MGINVASLSLTVEGAVRSVILDKSLLSMCTVIVAYKSNFASLQKLVLVGGPDDGVITPWQSRCACMPRGLGVRTYVIMTTSSL